MINRFVIIPLGFLLSLLIVFVLLQKNELSSFSDVARTIGEKPTVVISNFFFHVWNSDVSMAHLKAEKLEARGESKLENLSFLQASGYYILKDQRKITYKAQRAQINMNLNKINLYDGVEISLQDSIYKSQEAEFDKNKSIWKGHGKVEMVALNQSNYNIEVKSHDLLIDLEKKKSLFSTNVSGSIENNKKKSEKLYFTGNHLAYDENKLNLELGDNTTLRLNDLRATSRKMSIWLNDQNKKLKYLTLNDDIFIKEKLLVEGEEIFRTAQAETLEMNKEHETIELKGSPSVSQGSNVVKGYRIIYYRGKDELEVYESRASMNSAKKNDE